MTMIFCQLGLRLSLPDSGRRPWGKRMIKSRAMLLAGVSALAMLACAGEAKADPPFITPGMFSFTVPTTGEYALDVFRASGGGGAGFVGAVGGLAPKFPATFSSPRATISRSLSAGRGKPRPPSAAAAAAVSSSPGRDQCPCCRRRRRRGRRVRP